MSSRINKLKIPLTSSRDSIEKENRILMTSTNNKKSIITPETSNAILDLELRKYVQNQWYDDFKNANLTSDAAEKKVPRYTTAASVFRRLLIPLCSVVGPLIGYFVDDEELRKMIVGAMALAAGVFTVSAEWIEYQLGHVKDKTKSVDDCLEKITEEIFNDDRVKKRFSAVSMARVEASLSRILSSTTRQV